MDITCVVTLHNEGLLAYRTFKSIHNAIHVAAMHGIKCEVVVVVDRASEETLRFVSEEHFKERVYTVDFGDPGLSRNFGISKSSGQFISILDGDDLISKNWLIESALLAKKDPTAVVHPAYNIFFGSDIRFTQQKNQNDADCDLGRFLFENYWSALAFANRKIFEDVKYEETNINEGFGYEDWHWNCEVMHAGYVHKVAADTYHLIRLKKTGSRNVEALKRSVMLRHSRLFDRADLFRPKQKISAAA